MNHIPEIAQMFGVEIGEEFRYKLDFELLSSYPYRFTQRGLEYHNIETGCWYNASFETLCGLLNGKYEIVKLPQSILTEEEREYLSMVIKPFKDEVYYICKNSYNRKFGWIQIGIKDDLCINLPTLKVGTMMYKGMEFDKRYSLEELDLS